MVRVSTDLPCPEGPTKPRISPRRMSRSSPFITARSPKVTTRSRTRMIASTSGRAASGSEGLPTRPLARVQKLIAAKKTAKRPSSTITMKIDLTTEAVTWRPSDSAEPWTANPSIVAMMPMVSAMNGALIRPTAK